MLAVILVSDFSNATVGAQTAVLWPFSAARLLKLPVHGMINERFAQNATEHVMKGKTKGNATLKERYHNSCLSVALSANKQTGPTQTHWDWHANSNVRGCYTFLYSDVRGHLYISVIIDRFYIALFSALEQTHCAHM